MGITIASCGHTIGENEEMYSITTKDHDITETGWQRVIIHQTVCKSCKEEYEAEGLILYNENEELDWLTGRN